MHALKAAFIVLSFAFAAPDPRALALDAGVLAHSDRAAILSALRLSANARGQVLNACGELTTPQFLSVELGGSVGAAAVFAIGVKPG